MTKPKITKLPVSTPTNVLDPTAPIGWGKDYAHPCDVCGQLPTVPETGMCGPCTWGEAETVNGNW